MTAGVEKKEKTLPAKVTKKLAVTHANNPPPVHFDFYAELPNRKITTENKPNNKTPIEKRKLTATSTKIAATKRVCRRVCCHIGDVS